ncbi:MAG: hypothetical protein KJ675_05815 [Gammaproteobacteria bacterium]|nr:hypothetical protein [Gammaproteobacteria bacterium]
MNLTTKITGTADAWESRQLGADEDFVALAEEVNQEIIDQSLDLRMVSIRLQNCLLDDLKAVAKLHGLGYQPLIKQVLQRFVDAEKKRLLRNAAAEVPQAEEQQRAIA